MMRSVQVDDNLDLVELEQLQEASAELKIESNDNKSNKRKKDPTLKLPLNRDSTCEWDMFLRERSFTLKKEEEGNLESSSSHIVEPNPIVIALNWLGMEDRTTTTTTTTTTTKSVDEVNSSHSSLPPPVLKWLEQETPDFLKVKGGAAATSTAAAEEEEEDTNESNEEVLAASTMASTSLEKVPLEPSRRSSGICSSRITTLGSASSNNTSTTKDTSSSFSSSSQQKDQQQQHGPLRLPLNRDSTCEWSHFLEERSVALKREEGYLGSSSSRSLPIPILKWLEEEEEVASKVSNPQEEDETNKDTSNAAELPSDIDILMSELSSHCSLHSGLHSSAILRRRPAQEELTKPSLKKEPERTQHRCDDDEEEWGSLTVLKKTGSRALRREEEDDCSSLQPMPTKKWLGTTN